MRRKIVLLAIFSLFLMFLFSYFVIGQTTGRILKVSEVRNGAIAGINGDKVTFVDINTGDIYPVIITSEGRGATMIDGNGYNVEYFDDINIEDDEYVEILGIILDELHERKDLKEKEIEDLEDSEDKK